LTFKFLDAITIWKVVSVPFSFAEP
jgi:hypothetical protein